MKRIITTLLTVLISHAITYGQWNLARFDGLNQFSLVSTPTESNAFVIGSEPVAGNYFLLRTNDGGLSWDSLSISGPDENFQVYDMHFRSPGKGVLAGYRATHQALAKTDDGGNTWVDITPDPGSLSPMRAAYFVDDDLGFASTYDGNFYQTSNGGTSWTTTTSELYVSDINFLDAETGFIAGHDGLTQMAVVLKTTNGGDSWDEVLSDSDPDLFVSDFDQIDVVDANVIFTNMSYQNSIYKSEDGGATWDLFEPVEFYSISDLDFTSATHGHVLSNEGSIWSTADGCATWTMEYTTEWGMYGPSIYLYDLALVGETGFVAGSNGLIKKYTAGVTAQDEIRAEGNFSIYPNPVSSLSELVINTPGADSGYEVRILSSGGQLVYSHKENSGGTSLRLNGLSLNAGTYTVVLTSKNSVDVKRIIVMQ